MLLKPTAAVFTVFSLLAIVSVAGNAAPGDGTYEPENVAPMKEWVERQFSNVGDCLGSWCGVVTGVVVVVALIAVALMVWWVNRLRFPYPALTKVSPNGSLGGHENVETTEDPKSTG